MWPLEGQAGWGVNWWIACLQEAAPCLETECCLVLLERDEVPNPHPQSGHQKQWRSLGSWVFREHHQDLRCKTTITVVLPPGSLQHQSPVHHPSSQGNPAPQPAFSMYHTPPQSPKHQWFLKHMEPVYHCHGDHMLQTPDWSSFTLWKLSHRMRLKLNSKTLYAIAVVTDRLRLSLFCHGPPTNPHQ